MRFKAVVHYGVTNHIVEGEAATWIDFVDKVRQKFVNWLNIDYHSIGVIRINGRNTMEI